MKPGASTTRPTGRLNWLWGLIGAVALAAVVGASVWMWMDRSHRRAVDGLVQQRVDEQVAAMAAAPQGPPPTSVKVAKASMRTAQQRVTVVGRLEEVRRSVIASEVEGRVLKLLTPAGREVVGGETVIAQVDPVWSGLAVEQAKADLAAAQATGRQSARELAHLEELAERSAADPQAIDDARAKAEADAANVLARQAALNRAEETQKRVDIVAPFDGVVSAKLTEQGQWLEPGSSVVEIVSRGQIDAVIDVPEQYITQVPVGATVEVEIEALGMTLTGEVVTINPDGSNAARTYPVKVRVDDHDGLLKVGMSVNARVPITTQKEFLMVPRDAVQFAATGPQVWLSVAMPSAGPGELPQGFPVDVDLLFGVEGHFAVEPKPKAQGMTLMPGMDVVVEGAERIEFPSHALVVVNAQSPVEAPAEAPGSDADPSGPPVVEEAVSPAAR